MPFVSAASHSIFLGLAITTEQFVCLYTLRVYHLSLRVSYIACTYKCPVSVSTIMVSIIASLNKSHTPPKPRA